jgi:two-component system, cell cycle sensor histidine kinase and response regulator CckA
MNNEKMPDMTILLVEDDQLLNKSIQKLLQREGFSTEGFPTGTKALERMTSSSSDVLLLLDYTLPDMNGNEVIARMHERGLTIPFIIVTGHGDEELAVEMMKLGAIDYIVKSVQFHEVVPAKVRRACEEIAGRRKLARTEEALKMAADEWQRTFDSIADAVFILDSEQRIVRCNRATLTLLGKPVEELIGMNCCKAIHGADTAIAGCPVVRMKGSLVRESGEMALGDHFYSITADPIIDSGDVLAGAVHVISDITERKQAEEKQIHLEEQLRQSQKLEAIGQLAGGVAHDFNNLLGGIMGNAELIQIHTGKDHELGRYVKKIVDSANKAADLTHQLLTFARKARVNFVSVDIHESIGNVIELLNHTIDKRIIVTTDFGAARPKITGDSNLLENALLNIAINARDAMPCGGTLTFATANAMLTHETMPADFKDLASGEYVVVSVKDTGTGIDKSTLQRIFEPFFTTKEAGKGTGLGLAAVYGCIGQHNGRITVDSEMGVGTTFTLFLPVCSIVKSIDRSADPVCIKGEGNVLVIDDDEIIGSTVMEILKAIGYSPVFFSDAPEALDYFLKNHGSISAVVLDIIMPKMNGLDIFRKMKEINPGVKVVVASGYSDNKQEKQIIAEGAMEFVQKPYRVHELSSALARAIGN